MSIPPRSHTATQTGVTHASSVSTSGPGRRPILPASLPANTIISCVDLDVTTGCNLACSYCFKRLGKTRNMSLETAKDAIEWLLRASGPSDTIRVNFTGGGVGAFFLFGKNRKAEAVEGGCYDNNVCTAESPNTCSWDNTCSDNTCKGMNSNQCEEFEYNDCSAGNYCSDTVSNQCTGQSASNTCSGDAYANTCLAEASNSCQGTPGNYCTPESANYCVVVGQSNVNGGP